MTASLREIKVYTTFPHRCSYLEGEEATTLFVDPRQKLSQELYTQLSLLGFRRSGEHVYRPHCSRCNACIASRVRVNEFDPRRSHRRIRRKNSDLRVDISNSIDDGEAFSLYRYYIESRHPDGDMYPPQRDQYESFLNDGLGCASYYRLYQGNRLVAVTVADKMLDGLAAIYTFFDPDQPHRSLGTEAVLLQISEAKAMGLPFVYLGYWIDGCRKMSYKSNFTPLELFIDGQWQQQKTEQTGALDTTALVNLLEPDRGGE
ncbi:MAG: arginyltransferase [Luminiphilus sp.]|nr:arginyltransferase [Luminiphilus sp.]